MSPKPRLTNPSSAALLDSIATNAWDEDFSLLDRLEMEQHHNAQQQYAHAHPHSHSRPHPQQQQQQSQQQQQPDLHHPLPSHVSYPSPTTSEVPPQHGFVPLYTTNPQTQQYHTSYQYPPSSSSSSNPTSPTNGPLADHELRRLRNTAASARFRAKKKQREATLEQSAKQKKEQLDALENRIKELEEENRWLKDLVMQKKDVREEIDRLRKRFGVVEDEMKEFAHKDGVGTE